jgi:hypothetical protein
VTKAAEVFHDHEILPLQAKLLEINEWVGDDVVSFNENV